MSIDLQQTATTIVHGLTDLIGAELRGYEFERHTPGFDPDRSDDKMKHAQERVKVLRRLREEFENEMARPGP